MYAHIFGKIKVLLTLVSALVGIAAFSQTSTDIVEGNLIQFNDNGFWCWYQDERAVIDVEGWKLITGSDASGSGVGGSSRNARIEGMIFDLNTSSVSRNTFMNAPNGCDDHNAPAFLITPDGKYLGFYAQHYENDYTRYRIFDNDSWSNENLYDWNTVPGGLNFTICYNNLFYLSDEGRIYNFVRGNNRSPNIMISDNLGDSWSFGGQLTQPEQSVGYVNGYFKYTGNGVDQIHFFCTEHHPRDYNTSLYHGYIQGGKSYNSFGVEVDDDISDQDAPNPSDFTQIFAAGTVVNGIEMTRCWNSDIQVYDDGTVAVIFKARADDDQMDHRYFYARFNGVAWTYTYLGKAGWKMYSSEEDYVGLGALHPNNPNIIYISTPYDPRNDALLGTREIFKGVTSNNGASFTWTPVTQHSSEDNFRPIVVNWFGGNTALLWCRGHYNTAQSFNAAIVGTIEYEMENRDLLTYVDATTANTKLPNGDDVPVTGPATGTGAADDQWHIRSDYGNGSTVYTSAESGNENSPVIRTRVTVPGPGSYDVWVNFWADTGSDWRIKAGLSESEMQIFRHMACKQVESGDHSTALQLHATGAIYLYQAYLGRVTNPAGNTIDIFVDDHPILTGGTGSTQGNNTVRTWYDGVSFTEFNYMTVSGNSLNIAKEAGSTASFNIYSNVDWEIVDTTNWLEVTPPTGSDQDEIVVTASENTSGNVRSSIIGITTSEFATEYIAVTQAAGSTPPTLVTDNEENEISVFPNPVYDKLTIELIALPAAINIYTLEGKLLLEKEAKNLSEKINLSGYTSGIYILNIKSSDQTIIRKLIKQ